MTLTELAEYTEKEVYKSNIFSLPAPNFFIERGKIKNAIGRFWVRGVEFKW